MRIRLSTTYGNPNINRYVASDVVLRDTFDRAATDLTTTATGDAPYLFRNDAGYSPIFATDGSQAYLRTGHGGGTSMLLVDTEGPGSSFQVGIYAFDDNAGAQFVIQCSHDLKTRLVAARVSASDKRWRIVRYADGVATEVLQTNIDMTDGSQALTRTYVDGALRVAINGVVVWSGTPLRGAPLAGVGVSGTAAGQVQSPRFDYLSVNWV